MWAGIVADKIIGFLFIDGDLNAKRYEQFLRNQLVPVTQALNEMIFFTHGCALLYYNVNYTRFLEEVYNGI